MPGNITGRKWDIIYGASLHVDAANQGLLNSAEGLVSALDPTGNGPQSNLIALTSNGANGAQDQITGASLSPNVSAVPLPATVSATAALLGLLGAWSTLRRRIGPVSVY